MSNTPKGKKQHRKPLLAEQETIGCHCDDTCDCDCQREMVLEKEDIELLYRALRAYQPTETDEHLHELLVEQFEEVLAVDFEMLEIGY